MRPWTTAGLSPVIWLVATGSGLAEAPIAEAVFNCADDKSIEATFYPEKVDLALSDGRAVELAQTMSGSGARYATTDESMMFWNKGNTAFITEGQDGAQTYSDCLAEPQTGKPEAK